MKIQKFRLWFRHRGADGLPDDTIKEGFYSSLSHAKRVAKSIAVENDWRLVSVKPPEGGE